MAYYQPLEIKLLEVTGLKWSIQAMRLPKPGSENDSFTSAINQEKLGENDIKLAKSLIRAGTDHGKFSRGIVAYLEIKGQLGFLIEFDTYKIGTQILSSSSSMHGELKELTGISLAEQKQADLPGKVYTRIVMISYQALRAMYKARRKHRHPDWQIFCNFIYSLPHFNVLIMPELKLK
jgi:hypothetical protein